ncbi:MAG: hypothetical protein E4G91_02160 [Candidatus Zixiibacteriota bacterium]|nr:MAG: hypothetical protein E4G91_02160 [candidate division Zixibacteria bacterium]
MDSALIGTWLAALLTLGLMSFIYKDNLYYKVCEAIFIGISAGYWFITYFWDSLYRKAWVGIVHQGDYILLGGVILGAMMLTRLFGKIGWIARWPLAFIVGATAGLKMMVYFTTNAMAQIHGTVNYTMAAFGGGDLYDVVGRIVILIGTVTGLIYFYFSKEHKGLFGGAAKVGTWFLMITFGASFGYTVMSRMSLLLGRIDFLLTDWLKLVK